MSNVFLFHVISITLVVALLAAFCLLLAYKTGIVEQLQVKGNNIVSHTTHTNNQYTTGGIHNDTVQHDKERHI